MLIFWGTKAKNKTRIVAIRDGSPTAVEAFARMFVDAHIIDDGTVVGRLQAVLDATEHRFVPGLHMGIAIGLTGFRQEFEDPWQSSTDQVGHFLTAVRLAYDPRFLSNPILQLLLGALGDEDIPLRLIIGHEKSPDPPNVNKLSLKTLFTVVRCFRAQYQSVTPEEITNFRFGSLDAIQLGAGLGNSMADLRLSYRGWMFGQRVSEGHFSTREEIAHWIRTELGGGQ